MDLLPVLTEGPSTTSTATRAQNMVELYGVLPAVADDGDGKPLPSKVCFAATGWELACPMVHGFELCNAKNPEGSNAPNYLSHPKV